MQDVDALKAQPAVTLGDRRAVSQDRVVLLQLETRAMGIVEHDAIVCVVEQRADAQRIAQPAEQPDHLRNVPLVHQGNINPSQLQARPSLEIRAKLVPLEVEIRKSERKLVDRPGVDRQQIGQRPVVSLFVADHAVAAGLQRAHQTPQEMGVAVVPIGDH